MEYQLLAAVSLIGLIVMFTLMFVGPQSEN